jgi:hypothetical protein
MESRCDFFGRLECMKTLLLPNLKYTLYLDDELMNSCITPELAAEAFSSCTTVYPAWDDNGPYLSISDLSDWDILLPYNTLQ